MVKMGVREAIKRRRAYRSLEPVEIDEELIKDLAESAGLAPPFFNDQPWRFIFFHDKLKDLHQALDRGVG
jgi:nitroreductase